MTNGLLPNGLDGIQDARDVRDRDTTTLEILLKTSDKILKEPTKDLPKLLSDDFHGELLDYSSEVHQKVSEQLNSVQINETDLEMFILYNSNSDQPEDKRIALGIFTGALAQMITERNAREGKRTRIYINGQGNRFDYLFLGAHNVDEIFVQNLRGKNICGDIQSAFRLVGIGLYGQGLFIECGDFRKEKTNQIREMVAIGINGQCNCFMLNKVEHLIAVGMARNDTDKDNNISIMPRDGYVERAVGINVGPTDLLDYGPCAEILLMGAGIYPMDGGSGLEKNSKCLYYNEVPQSVGAELYRILYASSVCSAKESTTKEYAQHKYCFDADKLAEHLKDKPQDEIVRIVDDVTKYVNELSARLLVR